MATQNTTSTASAGQNSGWMRKGYTRDRHGYLVARGPWQVCDGSGPMLTAKSHAIARLWLASMKSGYIKPFHAGEQSTHA